MGKGKDGKDLVFGVRHSVPEVETPSTDLFRSVPNHAPATSVEDLCKAVEGALTRPISNPIEALTLWTWGATDSDICRSHLRPFFLEGGTPTGEMCRVGVTSYKDIDEAITDLRQEKEIDHRLKQAAALISEFLLVSGQKGADPTPAEAIRIVLRSLAPSQVSNEWFSLSSVPSIENDDLNLALVYKPRPITPRVFGRRFTISQLAMRAAYPGGSLPFGWMRPPAKPAKRPDPMADLPEGSKASPPAEDFASAFQAWVEDGD